jgi:hypothetical protein
VPNLCVANVMNYSICYVKGKGLNVLYSGKFLLVLASTVILGSGSRGTHDHIFLYHASGNHRKVLI